MVGEQGVSDWPISDLADRADVALGSFYNHFADRDEFLEELVKHYVLDRQELLLDRNIPDDTFAVRIAHRFAYLVDVAVDDPAQRKFFISVGLGDYLYRQEVNSGFLARLDAARSGGNIDAMDLGFMLSSLRGLSLSMFRYVDFLSINAPEAIDRVALRSEVVRMALAISNVTDQNIMDLVSMVRDLEPIGSRDLT